MAIRIARNLSLSVDAQTETFALLAVRGAGKTYLCLKMAEEMHEAGLQFVFVDPTGVSWGLRSSADGKRSGLPVLIFGGEHGDVPLEEGSGAMVADFIVDETISCVLDLSDFSKGKATRFMCEFAERLYQRKNRKRDPLHIFLDEADAFAPQRPMRDQARMLGAVEDLIRRGRSRGIGLTLATQRSAVLNKNVLTQCETLVAMRVVAPQDIKAVDEWLKHAGNEERRQDVLDTITRLETGQAVFWSPRADMFKTVRVSKRKTFDSSSTPKAGKRAKTPKTRADVDLEAVRLQMAATVERAEARDPRRLQQRIRELERDLAKQTRLAANAEHGQEALETAVADARSQCAGVFEEALTDLQESVLREFEERFKDLVDVARDHALGADAKPVVLDVDPTDPEEQTKPLPKSRGRLKVRLRRAEGHEDDVNAPGRNLPAAKQRILDALAFLASVGVNPADRTQLALFADASPKSSGYANNLGALRTEGFIDYPAGGKVCLTQEGRAEADGVNDITTEDELHEALRRKLPAAKWRIVEALIKAYPGSVERADLAGRIGVSAASSGYANNLGSLRTLGLIEYPVRGWVTASSVLFLAGGGR